MPGASAWCAGWRACTPTPTRGAGSTRSFAWPATPRRHGTGNTFQIEFYTPIAAQSASVALSGGPVVAEGGLRLTGAMLYRFLPEGAENEQLAADLPGRAKGRIRSICRPRCAWFVWLMEIRRRRSIAGCKTATAAVCTPVGESDNGTQFFEFAADPLPPGEYDLWAIPTKPNLRSRSRWLGKMGIALAA
ncbi:MAG: hypothetical protein H6643_05375 [Caldilineaceae bacterium]|nr:hypothetical protein [Caldilineaceae bacterium]